MRWATFASTGFRGSVLACLLVAACGDGSTSASSANGGADGGAGSGAGGGGGGGGSGGGDTDGGGATGGGGTGGGATIGTTEDGEATYYDATGAGACSFDATPNDLMVAALNATEYANAAVCGECLKVTGELGDVIIRVVDECPGCRPNGGIDLSPQAFEKVAPKSKGRVPVTLTLVSCNTTGNLKYRYKDGSSEYWTAIQVQNHKVPIAKLEYQSGGSWVDMPRTSYNYFLADKGVGKQPGGLSIRVTSTDGQVVSDTLPATFASTALVDGAAQFH